MLDAMSWTFLVAFNGSTEWARPRGRIPGERLQNGMSYKHQHRPRFFKNVHMIDY